MKKHPVYQHIYGQKILLQMYKGRKALCKCIQASMLQHNQIILREHSQTLREHLRNTQGTLRAHSEKHSDNAHIHLDNTQRTLRAHLDIGGGIVLDAHLPLIKYKYL